MAWYAYLAYFFAGFFLANGVPHFVNGISGKKFPSPFASPPGRGESSPLVNALWGLANFFIGYTLIFKVGDFHFGMTRDVLMVGLGALAAGQRRVVGLHPADHQHRVAEVVVGGDHRQQLLRDRCAAARRRHVHHRALARDRDGFRQRRHLQRRIQLCGESGREDDPLSLPGPHEAESLLAVLQLAGARTHITLDTPILEPVPEAGRND